MRWKKPNRKTERFQRGNHMPGLFSLGRITARDGVHQIIHQQGRWEITHFLWRHHHADWGEIDWEDIQQNEFQLARGGKLFSAYTLTTGDRVWITTEGDRSLTTLAVPEEYTG
jgi:hypothetical protein